MLSERIKRIWLGSEVVEFGSAYNMDMSVERLRNATKRSIFFAMARQEAVGTVKPEHVSLRRVIPMTGNSFKPYFRGSFLERDGKVVLCGRFGMHWLVKVFMSVWFGFIFAMSLLCLSGAFKGEKGSLGVLIGALGMCCFGVLLLAFGRWLARNDEAWLSNVIRGALSAQGDQSDDRPAGVGSHESASLAPAGAACFVAANGLFYLWSAVSGVSSYRSDSHGVSISYYTGTMPRGVMGFIGALLLAWAYCLYRRSLWAWRAGLIVLCAVWAYAMFVQLPAIRTQTRDSIPYYFMLVGFNVVIFAWGFWWHAQRVHFNKE